MELSIISVESIKPSSPMYNFQPFKLSFLDQIIPEMYTPLIFFYPLKDTCSMETICRLNKLKKSLSKTLNLFYPLSGRVKNNLFISEYNEGVPFTEARVKGRLSDFLHDLKLELLNQFCPYEHFCLISQPSLPQVAVQANIFDCGGMALGMSFSHKIGDGVTVSSFLQSWAANASGCYDKVIQPNLSDASSLFPPLEQPLNVSIENLVFKKRRFGVRRFVFYENAIDALKTKSKSNVVENPSRAQALFAFIWKSAMEASRRVHNSQRPSIFMQEKDLRRVTKPRCSRHAIGNLVFAATTRVVETEMELSDLVVLMKEGLDRLNSDFLNTARILQEFKNEPISHENLDMFNCTSWNTFAFNDVDFGWGKPVWLGVLGKTSRTSPAVSNLVILKTVVGNKNAVEAWVSLDEEVAAFLDNDPNFLAFATPNPAILTVP